MNRKKRVLVTGATGFIGRQSVRPLLERGFEVHAVYQRQPLEIENVIWHHVDLLDALSAKKVCADVRATHLLHFAWYVSPKDYKTSPQNEPWIAATTGLLKTFAENGGTRAVMAGTCMEYDWSIPQEFLSEDTSPIKPDTPYGMAKFEAHELSQAYAKEHGLALAWGRIFHLFGTHEARMRLVPYVINALLRSEPALCTSGEQLRDFSYVKDIAGACVALADSPVTGAVNIGSGVPIALKDLLATIATIIKKSDLIRLGAKPTPPHEPVRLVANVSRVTREVGWKPCYTLERGLEETTAWWKENTE